MYVERRRPARPRRPRRGRRNRQPRRAGDRSGRARFDRRGAGRHPDVIRAGRLRARGHRGVGRGVGSFPAPRRSQESCRGGLVSEVTGVLRGVGSPVDLWDESAVSGLGMLEALAYRSNLLGADRALANQGGGNTSAKRLASDHLGREIRVLWVKGSGTDLATITPGGFAALRLDEILPLIERGSMGDAEMVDYLRRCGLSPDQPRPSIETLLHAFVEAEHVDHTHPDAVIALTSSPEGRRLAEEAFERKAVWLDYERPGFAMSKRIAELLRATPEARAVLLEKHGLVTWGETGAESYAATLEFVTRSAEAIRREAGSRFGLGGPKVTLLGDPEAEDLLTAALPTLRGALLAFSPGVVLRVDRSPEAVAFASSGRAPTVSQTGAPCPDHLIHTKHKPLVVDFDPDRDGALELREALREGVSEYATWYRDYCERNLTDESRPFPIDPAGPRVVLVPGVGIVTSGADAARARTSRDLYHRAIAVQDAADALGSFRSLSESEAFAIEYWPLERYKLAQAPAGGELSGRVALIVGGASGIGRATARVLAERGAHVAVADLNGEGSDLVAAELDSAYGEGRATSIRVDVTDERAVAEMIRQAVLAFGGLDILIASPGLATSAPVTETTVDEWERNHAVLVRGYFLA